VKADGISSAVPSANRTSKNILSFAKESAADGLGKQYVFAYAMNAVGDIDWVLHIRAAVLEHWADYGSAPSWPPPDDPIEADARQRIVNKHVEEKSAVLLVHWADFLRGLTGKMQLPRSAVHEARERKGKSRFGDGWSSVEDYYEADEEANAA
jgi:hypothetical protein